MESGTLDSSPRMSRQQARQHAISEAVMTEGAIRIEDLAQKFDVSLMTVHRDLNELEDRGLLRKSRGVATAAATSLVESSDVYRSAQQIGPKEAIAHAALEYVEPGQAISIDDSTTVLHMVSHLHTKAPVTVITNTLTVMNELRNTRGVTVIGLGGEYYNWCSSFMGRMTVRQIADLRSDLFIMSTSAIIDDVCFHQSLETVDVKRAMFETARKRVLLVDGSKFEKRALHAMLPIVDFDVVIVDAGTSPHEIERLRDKGVNLRIAHPATKTAN